MSEIHDLIEEIEAFKLKAAQKEEWEIHTGDIVINKSIWREIKDKYW